MRPRERFLRAVFEHKEPDRVPVDLGSHQSGIMANALGNVLKALDLDYPIKVYERTQDLAEVPDELLSKFGVDTRYVFPVEEESIELPEINGYRNNWGITLHKPEGVLYYEFLDHPFAGVESIDQLAKIEKPRVINKEKQSRVVEAARAFRSHGYAVGTTLPGLFEQVMYMVGTEKFMVDLLCDLELFVTYYEKVLDLLMNVYTPYLEAIANQVDFVEVYSDFASQRGPLFSPDSYRKVMKPRDLRWVEYIRHKTNAHIAWHTCGASSPFYSDLIDLGVELVNPVQVSAAGMDTKRLKREFGRDLSFWGAIDTQRVLPRGNVREVRDEVKKRIADLAPGGGYLLASVHNIQADVPARNVIAMFEAALDFGRYR